MKQIVLVSQASFVMQSVAQSLKISAGDRLVCITTAIETKDSQSLGWFEKDRQSLVQVGFEVTNYTITGKTTEEIKHDLAIYDYIYVSGGDTIHLVEQSHKSGFVDLVKQLVEIEGKTYIGSSAGSIACAPHIPNFYDLSIVAENEAGVKGYNLVNLVVMPHWGRKDYYDKYIQERLPKVFDLKQHPFFIINDNQYIYMEDDCYKVVDVRGEIRNETR